MAMYSLRQREHIAPYIDLNLGNTRKTSDDHGVTIGPDGIPICKAGLKMKSNGNESNSAGKPSAEAKLFSNGLNLRSGGVFFRSQAQILLRPLPVPSPPVNQRGIGVKDALIFHRTLW